MTEPADRRESSDPDGGSTPVIPFRFAVPTWVAGWMGGLLVTGAVLAGLGADFGDLSVAELAVAAVVGYLIWAAALVVSSRRTGSGKLVDDYAISFRLADLWWAPAGVAGQVWLIPWLYIPLEGLWPDTFNDERIEERARDLVEGVDGVEMVVLVLVVAVAAPLVEEIVYRGMVQRSMGSVVGAAPALVFTSAWFALVHPVAVEYPGLFVAGLLFGLGVVVTGRIGPGIVAHAAFNAAGLVIVAG